MAAKRKSKKANPQAPTQSPPARQVEAFQFQQVIRKGLLPPAEELERLEALQPGITERLLGMVEAESEHRRATQRLVVESGIASDLDQRRETKRGQIFALVFVLSITITIPIVMAIAPDEHGAQAARWIGGTAVAAVCLAFVIPRVAGRQRERRDTAQE